MHNYHLECLVCGIFPPKSFLDLLHLPLVFPLFLRLLASAGRLLFCMHGETSYLLLPLTRRHLETSISPEQKSRIQAHPAEPQRPLVSCGGFGGDGALSSWCFWELKGLAVVLVEVEV